MSGTSSTQQKCSDETLAHLRARDHAYCTVCGPSNPMGLQLTFHSQKDGSVEASFACSDAYQGYRGIVHGGVLASLLDGAMANCLFAHGTPGVTGHFAMRILHPVVTEVPILIKARQTGAHGRLRRLEGGLSQEGRLVVKATAKFMVLESDNDVPEGAPQC